MLDLKLIRGKPDFVKENLKRRNFDISQVDKVLKLDKEWRAIKKGVDELRSKRNKESQKINELKKEGKNIGEQVKLVKQLKEDLEKKEKEEKIFYDNLILELKKIPNLLDEKVPIGKDDSENVVIKTVGKIPKFNFKPRIHIEICEHNDWFDLGTASKFSGARFYYLKNELVELNFALYNYVIQKFLKKNYTLVETPPMLRREAIDKSISLSDFEDVIYKIENEDLYLIATAEHALALLHADQVLNYKELPMKYLGFSPSFRKEAGVTKDSKGIFRVHNFNKFEQFVFSHPDESEKIHQELLNNIEEIFTELEIPYQVVDICTGDIGHFASRKFDLEAWLPGQSKYREMGSASNYRDYGARRLNCKFQDKDGKIKYVHTLNNTAIALTRTLVAIIENYQTEDMNVKIPGVLKPYLGREYLRRR